jgi:hypothetical protein
MQRSAFIPDCTVANNQITSGKPVLQPAGYPHRDKSPDAEGSQFFQDDNGSRGAYAKIPDNPHTAASCFQQVQIAKKATDLLYPAAADGAFQ